MLDKLKKKFLRIMEEYDVTFEELKKKQGEGAIIVDVRNKRAYNEGNIKGSINIPEYEIIEKIGQIIPNKHTKIVVYCDGGYRSKKAYKKLKKLGYDKVYNLYEGIDNY